MSDDSASDPDGVGKTIRDSLPDKSQIMTFIDESQTPVDKREIARAFKLKGAQRTALRDLLKEMEDEGLIDRGHGKKLAPKGALPEVMVLAVETLDRDGELWAAPTGWNEAEDGPRPTVVITHAPRHGPAPKPGDRVLARLRRISGSSYEGSVIRVLQGGPSRLLGVLERTKGGATLLPTDKRNDKTWFIPTADMADASPGDLVLAEPLRGRREMGRQARVVEHIGRMDEPKAFSLIAIHGQGIPVEFPEEALSEAESLKPPSLGRRTDLRGLPLITIDGADARDFDDAVHAAPDDDPANPDGHVLTVAIADVAYYVRAESPLDISARDRGNSVYFPDRVVPMLPERLSNDLCSLRPNEERACLAVRMRIDNEGRLIDKKIMRGLMRSAARLTYEQVQAAIEGQDINGAADGLVEPVIRPLYDAFSMLDGARKARGALDLDIAELQVLLNDDGKVEAVVPRRRLDSHRLIEEFMITANVATAELLEERNARAIMYRVHPPPALDKLEALKESLAALGIKAPGGAGPLKPHHFTKILGQSAGTEKAQLVSDMVLRSQSQAFYAPENEGHFGLALRRYCHFTSPIRRYADLLIHRALISAYGLGDGGLPDAQADLHEKYGEHISNTERRAVAAEREATDRYLTAFMSERVGATFTARVSGVKRFGLFVRLDETGADGLVPVSQLPWDRYWHDEIRQRLIGEETGQAYQLAESLTVRLIEANTVTGGLIFEVTDGGHVVKDRKARRPAGKRRQKSSKARFGPKAPRGRRRGR